jgi:hypothetical protein
VEDVLSLGRYAVDGYIFQAVVQDCSIDPLQVYCVIYYQYTYHLDRLLELPYKLEARTRKRAIPFLEKHKQPALIVDTKKVTWKKYAASLSLSHQWTEVNQKTKHASPPMPPLHTMDVTNASPVTASTSPTVPPLQDDTLDFSTDVWFDPPPYITDLPEISPETNIHILAEIEYRKSAIPTEWLRYMTLGRYAVDGFTFNTIMEESTTEPLKMHCLIWFQYSYHLDYQLEIPAKLQAWLGGLLYLPIPVKTCGLFY